jgi:hypothetical protein
MTPIWRLQTIKTQSHCNNLNCIYSKPLIFTTDHHCSGSGDLCTKVSQPTDSGTTYTFKIRDTSSSITGTRWLETGLEGFSS